MPSPAIARAANAAYSFPRQPVALIVGGTSGIGQAVAQSLATHTNGNAHIIISGRNRTAADAIIASFPKPTSPDTQHEFVECDVSLMKNVAATTSSLLSRLTKINYLVLSPGIFSVRGRDETLEGIDKKMALHYYARWKFIYDLLPLLNNAKKAGEDAKVMSVLGPKSGKELKIDLNDLGLKKNYGVGAAATGAMTYNDLMVESFANEAPGVSFVHVQPGPVRTPIVLGPTSLIGRAFGLLLYPIRISAEDCAEHQLYALLHAEAGAHYGTSKGDKMVKERFIGEDDAKKRLWEHTWEEVQRALHTDA